MNLSIRPCILRGTIKAPASKSEAHRLLICAALSKNISEIKIDNISEDISATIRCLRALGISIKQDIKDGSVFYIIPSENISRHHTPVLDCGQSGSTLRFMIPSASVIADRVSFTGSGRLPERPIKGLLRSMACNGISYDREKIPLTVSGHLRAGEYAIEGNVSSQYITGLLIALSATEGKSSIILTSGLESHAYVDLTLDILRKFGADITEESFGYTVNGRSKLSAPSYRMEPGGDWSNAAFFFAADAIGGAVKVTGLADDSKQADRAVSGILRNAGATVSEEKGMIVISEKLRGTEIDINETPDLMPALSACAAFAYGTTEFKNGRRLRTKESDRIHSVCSMINDLGGRAEETGDGLIVHGSNGSRLKGGTVESFGDHRIVMAASIMAQMCEHNVIIKDAGAVAKSYPDFFYDLKRLGGVYDVI